MDSLKSDLIIIIIIIHPKFLTPLFMHALCLWILMCVRALWIFDAMEGDHRRRLLALSLGGFWQC